MSKICNIAAALAFDNEISIRPGDLLIAADAGYEQLVKRGLKPDLIVGDFDSLGSIPESENIVRHPVMKDDTDLMLAIRLGLERGYKFFYIYGGLGGRLDHTIANIQALDFIAHNGGIGYLFGEAETVTVFADGVFSFPEGSDGIISVFAQGGIAEGVTLKGLLYPLNNATLTPSYPLGVSNEFTGSEASVTVKKGRLLVIWTGGHMGVISKN
jgi:thiamine pyrophosphokinase